MVLPGSTIGILGGGQLGRMTILAGRHMGYHFGVYEPSQGCTAGKVADWQINEPYTDKDALTRFANQVDRITIEFENIPTEALEILEETTTIYPGKNVLHVCQNRKREKEFLKDNGFPCVPFKIVKSADELVKAIETLGGNCVLKTAQFGYDGKGQIKVNSSEKPDCHTIWNNLQTSEAIVEKWVSFKSECSIICCRNEYGEETVFPMAENIHCNHILHASIVPARISDKTIKEAETLAKDLTETLKVIGPLAIELFLTEDEKLLVNEMAPRPHNSGHYTIDACVTGQFEQHVRSICGLPLGETRILSPIVMVNLLGDLWHSGEPDWQALLKNPNVKLHLYDKGEPRPGRKMGHFCVLNKSLEEALSQAEALTKKVKEKQKY